MASEVDPPERQAEEALRAAVRAILEEGSKWAREQHGVDTTELDKAIAALQAGADSLEGGVDDLQRELEMLQSMTTCSYGPDCECPFHTELRLRQRRRQIAQGWGAGTCTRCGLSDEPVKGPAGAELCRFCEELRILAPMPPRVIWRTGGPVIPTWNALVPWVRSNWLVVIAVICWFIVTWLITNGGKP